MTRPLVGLTAYRERARWRVWDTSADLLPTVYARSLEEAGAVPVLLPPVRPYRRSAALVLDRLDGLVVTGGPDVDPRRYAAVPHAATEPAQEERDAWELALLDAATGVDLPTLGICRGMQLMAVHAGGLLEQHLPEVTGDDRHSPGGDRFGSTVVRTRTGSLVRSCVGERLTVHCHHHQAVRSHPGAEATAWAEDGTVEAIEATRGAFHVGVQWHPEMAVDAGLFAALVRAAAGRSRS